MSRIKSIWETCRRTFLHTIVLCITILKPLIVSAAIAILSSNPSHQAIDLFLRISICLCNSGTPRSPYGALSPTSTHGTLPPASPYSATQWAGAPSRGGSLSASGGLGTDDAAAVAAASSARQDAYFSELLTYSLERLAKEPELLKEDQKQLRRQQQVGNGLNLQQINIS